jgi:3-methyladenine DNA glycosylase/8-oxoguanine DNA glycosylase
LETDLSIKPAPPFHYGFTAYSHGWVVLAPNTWDDQRRAVQRQQRLNNGEVVTLDISDRGSIEMPEIVVRVSHAGILSPADRAQILDAVEHMFRVDEDLSEFYALCRQNGGRWEKLTEGLGRLLRSPTVFEDVVKTILTTNVQWGGTKRMVMEVVNAFGEAYPADPSLHAFPLPQAIAAVSLEQFTQRVRLGYRAPYIYELAQRVAGGELDLEALKNTLMPTSELKKELLAIKGVGNYAAATLLMLLGRYDELAVDTVFRTFVSQKYFAGEQPSDALAKAVYEEWGKWKYLAYWFDIWEGFEGKL